MKMNTFKYKFADNIYTKQNLAKYTWFGVGGNAELLYIPEDEISLEKFLINKPNVDIATKSDSATKMALGVLLTVPRVAPFRT